MDFTSTDQRVTDSGGAYGPAFQLPLVNNTQPPRTMRRHIPMPVVVIGDYSDHRQPEISIRFRQLANQWTDETRDMSSLTEMVAHPAYREILTMGSRAVSLILGELQKRPNHWFIALESITKENPVPEAARGKLIEMTEAWLKWGRKVNLC